LSAGISWLARAGASAAGGLAKGAGGAAKNFADDVTTKADDLADEAIESAGKGRSRGSLCPERNRLIETGIPRMDGQWVRRWTRITREDELKMAAEISREHTRLTLASKHMTWDESRAFVYEGMRQFRTKLRENFLRNRKY
jgi:hypothetical protein